MRNFLIIIIGFLGCCNLYGQTDTAYILTYGGIQNDVCNQIKATSDGGYIMIGTSNSFGCGNTDFYAVKIDSLGRHEWSRTYGGEENEEGFSVTQTFDHGYAFLGFTDSYGAGGYDVFLVKTDSMGNFQWQKTYGGSDWDFGYSIQQLSDSGFVICGLTYSFGAGNGNAFVIRTNKYGDTAWTRVVGSSGTYSSGNSICSQNDSLFGIIGNLSSTGDTSVYFILMDNKGIVKRTIKYGSNHNYYGNSINETKDDGFIIFGSTDSIKSGKPDEMMIKTDSIGDMQWMQVYGNPGVGFGRDAVQISDGTYVTVGTNNSYGYGGYAMHIQHFQSDGVNLTNALAGPSLGGVDDEQGNFIAVAKNGNIIFAGASNSSGFTDGLSDIMLVRWISPDSINNIRVNYIKNFQDTSICTLGIANESPFYPEVKIFPNPVSFYATILVQGTIGEHYMYSLYNEAGQCIAQKISLQSTSHGQSSAQLQKGNLVIGIYICEILNENGIVVATNKFVIQ